MECIRWPVLNNSFYTSTHDFLGDILTGCTPTLLIIHIFKYICTRDPLSTNTTFQYWQANSFGGCWWINALVNVSLMATAGMGVRFFFFPELFYCFFWYVPLPPSDKHYSRRICEWGSRWTFLICHTKRLQNPSEKGLSEDGKKNTWEVSGQIFCVLQSSRPIRFFFFLFLQPV